MAKCRKKPIILDYWRWNGVSMSNARQFCEDNGLPQWKIGTLGGVAGLMIPVVQGMVIAQQGDYILKSVNGEYCSCEASLFEAVYEKLETD